MGRRGGTDLMAALAKLRQPPVSWEPSDADKKPREENEEEAEQVVETTSMLETITVSAVAIIVGALAFRFLSPNQAKRIADRVRDFFFSGRSS